MAATENIGQVQTIYLKSQDQLGNKYETNINGRNMTVNPRATYQDIDTAMRALNNLTDNNYEDTTLITEISVMEKMQD